MFCREIDSDYSTPPAFPFRVLYSSQPRFHGFRLPDREWSIASATHREAAASTVVGTVGTARSSIVLITNPVLIGGVLIVVWIVSV